MPSFSNPSEIAREALRLLAVRRLSPSPANYRALYNEIAGIAGEPAETFPEPGLKALLSPLPKETAGQQKLAKRFEQALSGRNWEELREGVSELIRQLGKEQDLPWSELFSDLLRQWENKQVGLTVGTVVRTTAGIGEIVVSQCASGRGGSPDRDRGSGRGSRHVAAQ
jgi:diguanylate cyclase